MTDWSEIVQQHGPIVWQTVYRLLSNEADAADCFQNAFMAALKVSRTQAVRNWPGLLKRLATTSALARLRQRHRESGRMTTLPQEPLADDKALDPVRRVEAKDLAERLRLALASLDERDAEVLVPAYMEGLSYRQIAEQLGVTVNHVGVLLNRARSNLRSRLRDDDLARQRTVVRGRFRDERSQ